MTNRQTWWVLLFLILTAVFIVALGLVWYFFWREPPPDKIPVSWGMLQDSPAGWAAR